MIFPYYVRSELFLSLLDKYMCTDVQKKTDSSMSRFLRLTFQPSMTWSGCDRRVEANSADLPYSGVGIFLQFSDDDKSIHKPIDPGRSGTTELELVERTTSVGVSLRRLSSTKSECMLAPTNVLLRAHRLLLLNYRQAHFDMTCLSQGA